jgi:hypothetical protein
MEIDRHEDVQKDFKELKRFASPEESLNAWELLFKAKGINETPGIHQIPGFGQRKIYKGRVVALRENIGKAKGYRVIFEVREEERIRILILSRHGIYKKEQELLSLIKKRIEL